MQSRKPVPVPRWSSYSFILRNRYTLLLLALLALTIGPLLARTTAGQSLAFGIAFLVVLLLAMLSIRAGRAWTASAAALAAAAAIAQIVAFVQGADFPPPIRLGLHAAFLSLVSVLIVMDVMRSEQVTWDKIAGAICAYLLVGVDWGLLYAWIGWMDPGSFGGIEALNAARIGEPMIYFSFATLTTLGYGDITPVGHAARTLAWLEAVVGQIYLVVMVARLVGLHVSRSSENTRTP